MMCSGEGRGPALLRAAGLPPWPPAKFILRATAGAVEGPGNRFHPGGTPATHRSARPSSVVAAPDQLMGTT